MTAEKHAHQASVDTRHVVLKEFDMHTLLICCVISFDFSEAKHNNKIKQDAHIRTYLRNIAVWLQGVSYWTQKLKVFLLL